MSDSPKETKKVFICIATYNRPEGLKRLLDNLQNLEFSKSKIPDLRVVIVDNSAEATARALISARMDECRWPLSYFHESKRGISFARNRGLEAALQGDGDYVAFIDDDEVPRHNWLDELLSLSYATQAEAVIGAVCTRYESTPPKWIKQGEFFDVFAFENGAEAPYGHTSNALIDLEAVRRMNLRFDPAFALTGGEDTLFFRQMRNHGGRTFMSHDAVVEQTIDSRRATLTWLLQRWYRTGNTDALIELKLRNSLGTRLKLTAGGILRVGAGGVAALLTAPLALTGDSHIPLGRLRWTCRGFGFLAAVMGQAYAEYAGSR